VFTLQSLTPTLTAEPDGERLAKSSGFSLHAGVAAGAHQRDKLERLCWALRRAGEDHRQPLRPGGSGTDSGAA
jgi:hypothetical protein